MPTLLAPVDVSPGLEYTTIEIHAFRRFNGPLTVFEPLIDKHPIPCREGVFALLFLAEALIRVLGILYLYSQLGIEFPELVRPVLDEGKA